MSRVLKVRQERWPLARPFTIARGTKTEAVVVVTEIELDGAIGRGECVPYARYGETPDGVIAAIRKIREPIASGLDRRSLHRILPAGAARNAVDCALWDLDAKISGCRAWDLARLEAPDPILTADTIVLDTAEDMGKAAKRLSNRPILKIKLDSEMIAERVKAVRAAAPRSRLIVDANEAWSLEILMDVGRTLADLGIEMVEQPLPAGTDSQLAEWDSPFTLCADESCHTLEDLPAVVGRYQMINVKLDKAGGLTEALALAMGAREAGLAVMAGCMVGTSLAMAPATLLAPFVDYADLDGPVWLARDREPPLRLEGGFAYAPSAELWG